MKTSRPAPRPRRSFLFVPGTGPEMFPKALTAAPDIVCVDLEDAIAPHDKSSARAATMNLFTEAPEQHSTETLVRVNCTRSRDGMADLLALLDCAHPPDGMMLPKIKYPDELKALDELLTAENSALRFQVIIETNEALEACHEIAGASPRIDALLFGGADMSAELRVGLQWEPLLYARSRLVHAAAAAQIDLIDVPWLDLTDEAGLDREAALAAELGMTGKGSIHPRQLPIIERHFTPDEDQINHARKIIQAFDEAGTGLVVVDGKLIEKPVLRSMYRIVAIAERIGAI